MRCGDFIWQVALFVSEAVRVVSPRAPWLEPASVARGDVTALDVRSKDMAGEESHLMAFPGSRTVDGLQADSRSRRGAREGARCARPARLNLNPMRKTSPGPASAVASMAEGMQPAIQWVQDGGLLPPFSARPCAEKVGCRWGAC